MPPAPDYDELIQPLTGLISRFLDGEFDYSQFQREFQPALQSYERVVQDRAYSPLGVIADIPRHCKSKLREYCQQALTLLPKEALDRSTRHWLHSFLIANNYFSFFDERGQSRFGAHAVLYTTPIEQHSFLLSALNGTCAPPPFQYAQLLAALRDTGGNELATWVYGTEPDNIMAVVERVWSLGEAYLEADQLRYLEQQPAAEGGASYLMLLPRSKQWVLLNYYDHIHFTIYLHGSRPFIGDIASQIKAEPAWDWRPADD